MFGPPGRQVQVILLDARWFRSPWKATDQRNAPGKERYLRDADPGKTMLGPAQWDWLEAQLRQPAQVRLIVSGIQVVADGHGWECWGNFPLERQRLYQLVARTGAQGVVFLSGDRHVGALYREPAGGPYPFFEMTSSGVTHTWRGAAEAGPNRLGELFTDLHYGTVELDWELAEPAAGAPRPAGRRAAQPGHSIHRTQEPFMTNRPFKVLGIQQIAIGGPDKGRLQKLWVELFGLEVVGTFKSASENVDEDICAMGTGPFKVEVDLMQPLDPDQQAGRAPAPAQPRGAVDRRSAAGHAMAGRAGRAVRARRHPPRRVRLRHLLRPPQGQRAIPCWR